MTLHFVTTKEPPMMSKLKNFTLKHFFGVVKVLAILFARHCIMKKKI